MDEDHRNMNQFIESLYMKEQLIPAQGAMSLKASDMKDTAENRCSVHAASIHLAELP